VNRYICYN